MTAVAILCNLSDHFMCARNSRVALMIKIYLCAAPQPLGVYFLCRSIRSALDIPAINVTT